MIQFTFDCKTQTLIPVGEESNRPCSPSSSTNSQDNARNILSGLNQNYASSKHGHQEQTEFEYEWDRAMGNQQPIANVLTSDMNENVMWGPQSFLKGFNKSNQKAAAKKAIMENPKPRPETQDISEDLMELQEKDPVLQDAATGLFEDLGQAKPPTDTVVQLDRPSTSKPSEPSSPAAAPTNAVQDPSSSASTSQSTKSSNLGQTKPPMDAIVQGDKASTSAPSGKACSAEPTNPTTVQPASAPTREAAFDATWGDLDDAGLIAPEALEPVAPFAQPLSMEQDVQAPLQKFSPIFADSSHVWTGKFIAYNCLFMIKVNFLSLQSSTEATSSTPLRETRQWISMWAKML